MSNIAAKIKALTKQLYPRGRTFNVADNSNIDKLHTGLAKSEEKAYNDAVSILDAILPDNPNFTTADATSWELRLGMIINQLTPLSDRKNAILRKMNHPGDIPARQSWDYIQKSLQDAAFNVYVHENIPEKTLINVLSTATESLQLNQTRLGMKQLGSVDSLAVINANSSLFTQFQLGQRRLNQSRLGVYFYNQKVVNNIDPLNDVFFDIGDNFRSTFFIGGVNLGDFATVDVNRRDEFRQLILKIKPVQSVGFLLINYI